MLGCGGTDDFAGALGKDVGSFAQKVLDTNIEARGVPGDSVSGFEAQVGFEVAESNGRVKGFGVGTDSKDNLGVRLVAGEVSVNVRLTGVATIVTGEAEDACRDDGGFKIGGDAGGRTVDVDGELGEDWRLEKLGDGRVAEGLTEFNELLALLGGDINSVIAGIVDVLGKFGILPAIVDIIGGDELPHNVFRGFASGIASGQHVV